MFIHKLLIKVAGGRDQKEEWKESFTKTYKEKFKAFQLRKKTVYTTLIRHRCAQQTAVRNNTHIFTKLSFRG